VALASHDSHWSAVYVAGQTGKLIFGFPLLITPFPIASPPSQSYPSRTSFSPESVHVTLTSHSFDWLVGGDTGRTVSRFLFPPPPSFLPPQSRPSRTPFSLGSVRVALASHDSDWPAVHVAGQIGKSISGSPSPSLPSQSRPSLPNRIPLALPFHPTASTWLSPAAVSIGWPVTMPVKQVNWFLFLFFVSLVPPHSTFATIRLRGSRQPQF
jgi:hypothetical protein